MGSVEPSAERLRSFVETDKDDGPVVMINLLRYRTQAAYPSGFEAEPFFKMLFLSLSFPAGMMGGAALTRAIFGGKENFESDVFIELTTIRLNIFVYIFQCSGAITTPVHRTVICHAT